MNDALPAISRLRGLSGRITSIGERFSCVSFDRENENVTIEGRYGSAFPVGIFSFSSLEHREDGT